VYMCMKPSLTRLMGKAKGSVLIDENTHCRYFYIYIPAIYIYILIIIRISIHILMLISLPYLYFYLSILDCPRS
jgi:hypothetical protein